MKGDRSIGTRRVAEMSNSQILKRGPALMRCEPELADQNVVENHQTFGFKACGLWTYSIQFSLFCFLVEFESVIVLRALLVTNFGDLFYSKNYFCDVAWQ